MKAWLQRRILDPVRNALTGGTSPRAVALALAVGFCLSLFPLLGATTALCAYAAFRLRLNLVIVQVANWIAAPVSAVLIDPNGLRRPIELMRRAKYLAYQDLTTAGAPDGVWIDRTVPHLVMRTYPVIAVSGYSIGLSFQTLSPDIVSDKTGAESHGMPAAWQRWGKLATAYDISGGSVMSLPERERARIEKDALLAKRALLGSNNREHAKRGHTQPRDF